MLDDAKSYLAKKAAELDLARGQVLAGIQEHLNQTYPGAVRAKGLYHGVLKIVTPSSAVASELRLRQVDLIKSLNQGVAVNHPISRLHITISTIDQK